jgi:hypothetical protein
MRIYYPGTVMVPLILLTMTLLSFTDGFGIIQIARLWNFWPITLIATGLEEIYLWSTSKKGR